MISRENTFIDLTELLNDKAMKKSWKYKIRHFINIISLNIFYKKYR